jgi:hypothetical protein
MGQSAQAFKQADFAAIWFDVHFTDELHQCLSDEMNRLFAAG